MFQKIRDIPWGSLGVDIVLECTGLSFEGEGLETSSAGARKVLISASANDADATVVYELTKELTPEYKIVSNASALRIV